MQTQKPIKSLSLGVNEIAATSATTSQESYDLFKGFYEKNPSLLLQLQDILLSKLTFGILLDKDSVAHLFPNPVRETYLQPYKYGKVMIGDSNGSQPDHIT